MEDNTTKTTHFPTGKREIFLLIALAVCGVLMADFILYGGFNVGFALMSVAVSALSFLYLRRSGCRGGAYANALFVLSLIIGASFLRSDDGFVKFVMLCFLLTAGNLGLVLTAGQNRRNPGRLLSLLDAPMAVFTFGLGQLGNSFGGLNDARKNAGTAGKRNMAVLTGLAVAVPVLALLIPLLIRADAAFEGLVNLLPRMNFGEPFVAAFWGIPMACVIYSRNTGLKHRPKADLAPWLPRYLSALTVNTVLVSVCLVYGVYLLSQLAYFVGGFAGILPEEYTMAEYARRGFFEMTWLAAINLLMMVVSVALTEPKDGKVPLFTRILCLFIGTMTLFFAATASAKMLMYIGAFGLTRLRLLVQVIIVFIALTVIFVALWLFRPKFAYMKAVLLTALIIGAAVAWADVDTVVAAYNVNAYRTGKLETVDMVLLSELGDGAVPYLEELTGDGDETVASQARQELYKRAARHSQDIRAWNIAGGRAWQILKDYYVEIDTEIDDTEMAGLDSPLLVLRDYTETVADAHKLMTYFAEEPREEEHWELFVEDGMLLGQDGAEVAIYLEPSSIYAIEQAEVHRIWVSECYVLFWSLDGSSAMLWTNSPDEATWRLVDLFGQIGIEPITDQWYLVTL